MQTGTALHWSQLSTLNVTKLQAVSSFNAHSILCDHLVTGNCMRIRQIILLSPRFGLYAQLEWASTTETSLFPP